MKVHETAARSFAKTVTYRLAIIIAQAIIVYAVTKDTSLTVSITGITNVVATIIYFFHERAWNWIHWGKILRKG